MLEPTTRALLKGRVILASGSPRRHEIIKNLGINAECVTSTYDEKLDRKEYANHGEYVQDLAFYKVQEVWERLKQDERPPSIVIGADTVVTMGDTIYGKPKDESDALRILSRLANNHHIVYTGVCLKTPKTTIKFHESTKVKFGDVTEEQLKAYVKTGEPMDKAGGYGIQGIGGCLIEKIDGDYYTVMGMPLYSLIKHLNETAMLDNDWTTDKIYDRCAYLNCYNAKKSTGHKLFRFPAYNDTRHHQWIRYTGNVRLHTWSSSSIRRAGICADHFPPESFTDETHQSLRRYAVPNPYSAVDDQAKASSTLIARIKSLSQERKPRRNLSKGENTTDEFSSASDCSGEPEEASSSSDKPVQPGISEASKMLCKIDRIKIEDQFSGSNNHTFVLERCRNPDNCPSNRQTRQIGEKIRPHYHKVCVSRVEVKMRNSSNLILGSDDPASRCKSEIINVVSRSERSQEFSNESRKRVNDKLVRNDENEPATSEELQNEKSENTLGHPSANDWEIRSEKLGNSRLSECIAKKSLSVTEVVEEYNRTKCLKTFDCCVYLNCEKSKLTGARLFRFPQSKDPRVQTWIKNAGNPKLLYWSWTTIRRSGLCSDHFLPESFYNETRQRLLRTAVPIPFYKNDATDANLLNENATDQNSNDTFEPPRVEIIEESNIPKVDHSYYKMDDRDLNIDNDIKREIENGVSDRNANNFNGNTRVTTESTKESKNNDQISSEIRVVMDPKEKLTDNAEDESMDDFIILNGDSDRNLEDSEDTKEKVEDLITLQREKSKLCKTIKRYSNKLNDAKIRKKQLRSQLLAYTDHRMH